MQQVIKAYAKINLTLDVLGARDDGYHRVEMIMQGISLHDIVTIKANDEDSIILTCSHEKLEKGPGNLAFEAAQLMRKEFRQVKGLTIGLEKIIPIQAGLAGGSTDAAAVLLGIRNLFNLGITLAELREYGAQLGSDVPFCLYPLTSLAYGRGELIRSLQTCPTLWVVLLKPPLGASTREVYGNLKNVEIKKRPHTKEAMEAIEKKDVDKLYDCMANVLQYSTTALYPELSDWISKIKGMGPRKVMMSGSGPTLMAFFDTEEEARRLVELWDMPDWQVFASRTLREEDVSERMVFNE